MKQTFIKSLHDILSPPIIRFVMKIAGLSLISTSMISWLLWDILFKIINTYLTWIPWEWLTSAITSLASVLVGYTLFIVMVSLFTALMSEKLLIKLANKHYPNTPIVGSADITTSVIITLKSSAIFLLFFVIFMPLLFIPLIGQVVMLYLWSILLNAPTVYDVGSLFITQKEVLEEKSKQSTLIAMIGSLFNYIPLLNVFAPLFAQILFLHYLQNNYKRN